MNHNVLYELIGDAKLMYDNAAKRVLSQKKILAAILKRTVSEFANESLDDIANVYIEGEPQVGTIPVTKDRTNAARHRQQHHANPTIRGDRNEDNSLTEGSVNFDIIFRAKSPLTKEAITLIINVEAQKSIHPRTKDGQGYPLMKRAVYYVSRLISSQKGTEFVGSDYGDIKKVYSIWICMDAPHGQSAINRYELREKHLLHRYKENRDYYDLMGIVFVYLGNKKVRDELMNMLYLVFKEKIDGAAKAARLKENYDIDITADGEEDLTTMCNLSEGIFENAFNQGITQGMAQGITQGIAQGMTQGIERGKIEAALEMLRDGMTIERVAKYTRLSLQMITDIARQNKLL